MHPFDAAGPPCIRASYLPFDTAHLDDEAALPIALDDLLAREPHLVSAVSPLT